MVRKIIEDTSPFPLSKAILHDHKYMLEISGQIGFDAETKKLVEGIENQTAKTLDNIKKILEEVGWDFTNVVKARIYLLDMKNYAKMNEVYKQYFTSNYPTRIALAVKELPAGALVEIECTAFGDKISQ